MSEVGCLGFSVDGEWLTRFIKEQFFYEGKDFDWVIQMISALFKDLNGLDDRKVEKIAQDVILGRSYFKGRTGNDFVFCDGSDEDINSDFFRKYATLRANFKKEEEARKDAVEAWQELALVVTGELKRQDCLCKSNIELLRPSPTEEYIERMIAPEEMVAPYGFIDPKGEFHPVAWAEHEKFAGDYIRAHDKWEAVLENDLHTGTDYLVLVKGWLLVHNPRQGKPFLTSGDKPMTKAQREALFDYYTKYGMKKEANALYEEVTD